MELPRSLLVRRSVYRSPASGRAAGVLNAGVLLKPSGAEGGYRDRTLQHFAFIYVLRGSGRHHHHAAGERRVAAGALIQHPHGHPHGVVPDSDGRWVEAFITIGPGFARELAAVGAIDPDLPSLEPGVDLRLAEMFLEIIDDLERLPEPEQPRILAKAHLLLSELYALDRRRRAPQDPFAGAIDRACQLLADQDAQRLRLDEVATRCGIPYESFRKHFRARIGVSPGAYRIARRIDLARRLLVQDRLGVAETAQRLGYADAFVFSKQFKRHVGVSPEGFRRMH